VVLALAATGSAPASAQSALAYMASHIDAYVIVDGADGPGQLALLLLDAVALGENPHSFGGTDLVSRLLATEQDAGADAGAFGTARQFTDQYASTYTRDSPSPPWPRPGYAGPPGGGLGQLARRPAVSDEQRDLGRWVDLPGAADQHLHARPANYGGPTRTRRPWQSRASLLKVH